MNVYVVVQEFWDFVDETAGRDTLIMAYEDEAEAQKHIEALKQETDSGTDYRVDTVEIRSKYHGD